MSEDRKDYELIQDFLKGSSQAFDVLYNRYKLPLYAYIGNLLGKNFSEKDDIFQKTWIKVIKNLPQYRDQEKFSAWLMRIARNLVTDYFRGTGSHPEDELTDVMENELMDESCEISWHLMDAETIGAKIRELLEEMNPLLREVFLLRQKGISFQEIAKIQNCSINTCIARMQYAVKQLRKSLSDWDKSE